MADGTQNPQDQAPDSVDSATQDSDLAYSVYPTKDEALADKPADAPKGLKPFLVSKNGTTVGWILGRGYDHALALVARNDGYTVSTGGKAAPVTKEAVAAKIASFSDAELAALGLSRAPATAPTTAAAPSAPAPTDPTAATTAATVPAPTPTGRGRGRGKGRGGN